MDIERRSFVLEKIEIRDDETDEKGEKMPKITGHAAVFGKKTRLFGSYFEQISKGAFKEALKKSDVRALFNHDPNYVLGRNISGTLTLKEDSEGLAVEIDPPDTDYARNLVTLMRRGDVTQMSFAFSMGEGSKEIYEEDDDGNVTRTIETVGALYDVSPVVYPAYPDTDVSVAKRGLEIYQANREAADNTPNEDGLWEIELKRQRLQLED